jgi:hypothetical protein
VKLVRAELARLFGRRFTKIMLGVVVLLLLVIGFGLGATSHKHNAQTRAQALAQIQQMRQQNEADVQRQRDECEASQRGDANAPKFPPGFDCSQIQLPDYSPTEQNLAAFEPHQFVFRTDATDTLIVVGFLLALLGFAVGASFVGAEWSSGGMMNLLLWRPRRVPVLAGKLFTLLVGMLGAGIVLSVAWVAAVYGIASVRGDTGRITRGLFTSLALTDARALGMMLVAAAIGFGIASLGRNTATALGLAVGYVIVLEIGTRIVLQLAAVARPERFFLSNYALAWLAKSQSYVDVSACRRKAAAGVAVNCEPTEWMLHMNQSLVLGGVLVAVVLVWAFVSFRRRDIT